MSTVDVNRTLHALRAESFVRLQSGGLEILDWTGLKDAGDSNPECLHWGDGAAEAG